MVITQGYSPEKTILLSPKPRRPRWQSAGFLFFGTDAAARTIVHASLSVAGCSSSSVPVATTDAGADATGFADQNAPDDQSAPSDRNVPNDHSAPDDQSAADDQSQPETSMDSSRPIDATFLDGGLDAGCPPPRQHPDPQHGGNSTVQVINSTADGHYVVYVNTTPTADGGSTIDIDAVPMAGGTPTVIMPNVAAAAAYPVVIENTVFIWNNVNASAVATLTIWTEATGAKLASTASAALIAAASPDSKHVVFSTGVNAAGTLGTLVSAAPATPGTQTTLLTNTAVQVSGSATFIPTLGFQPSGTPSVGSAGFVSNDYFVTSHQESGAAAVTISSWDTATWKKRDLVVDAQSNSQLALQNWNADTAGEHIAALTRAGQLEVIPVAGPASAAVAVGPATGTTTFTLQGSGDGIVYGNPPAPSETSPKASLFTTALPTPSPKTILSTGFGGVYFPSGNGVLGPSPDEKSFLYFSTQSAMYSFLSDLKVVANSAAATPTSIVSTDTATVPADPFTADSKYVLCSHGCRYYGGRRSSSGMGHRYEKGNPCIDGGDLLGHELTHGKQGRLPGQRRRHDRTRRFEDGRRLGRYAEPHDHSGADGRELLPHTRPVARNLHGQHHVRSECGRYLRAPILSGLPVRHDNGLRSPGRARVDLCTLCPALRDQASGCRRKGVTLSRRSRRSSARRGAVRDRMRNAG